jgi:hypothetical protein
MRGEGSKVSFDLNLTTMPSLTPALYQRERGTSKWEKSSNTCGAELVVFRRNLPLNSSTKCNFDK